MSGSQLLKGRWWICALSVLLLSANLRAQLRQIDPAKLPQDERIQKAYASAVRVEAFARNWSPKWTYDTPKEQVVSVLTSSLQDLKSVATTAGQNEELLLLTGFVAHLAYNVDVDETYEPAVQFLENARKLNPTDYRAEWFLAVHRCQSNAIKDGMQQMLTVEERLQWKQLPIDFWDDYITCATMSRMPAHTLRAIDHAVHLGASSSSYSSLADVAQKRFKSTNADASYPADEAWESNHEKADVRFTSQLCGMRFSAHGDWHLRISDVAKGMCVTKIESGPYPSNSGTSVPTMLVLTRIAGPQESLEAFVQSILKDRFPLTQPVKAVYCPAEKCLSFEIIDRDLYPSNGGGHFLEVAFADEAPEFPGLRFEEAEEPPKTNLGDKVTYYHPTEKLHRLPGTLYSVVLLDTNGSIFEKARSDFEYLLKSMVID